MKRRLIYLITATTALLLAFTACSNGNGPSPAPAPPTPTTIAVTGVTLNKTSAEISAAWSETLVATIQPWNASNKAVSWASDNTGVAVAADAGQAPVFI